MAKKNNEPQGEVLFVDDETYINDLDHKLAYVLCVKNEARGRVYDADGRPLKDPEYSKRRNLLMRSAINWPGGKDPFTDKQRARGRYLIRYYDGCTTLFIDDQPKDPTTLEPLIAGTREFLFNDGFLFVDAADTMLLKYVDWASWNEGSPYRSRRTDAIYKLHDTEQMRKEEAEQMDKVEQALAIAKKAPVKHMRIHAKFLEIPEVDTQTSRPLSDEAIRTEYRKAAMHKPNEFIKTYNDKSIHLKHWITQALASGELSTTMIPNRAVWAKRGIEICDLSGLQSTEGILNKLIEFANSDMGSEFKEHLESLYNK